MLLYLEGIERSGGAESVRDSMMSDLGPFPNRADWDPSMLSRKLPSRAGSRAPSRISRAASRVASQRHQSRDMEELANSEVDYVDVQKEVGKGDEADEIASNEQDGLRSELMFGGHDEVRGAVHFAEPLA